MCKTAAQTCLLVVAEASPPPTPPSPPTPDVPDQDECIEPAVMTVETSPLPPDTPRRATLLVPGPDNQVTAWQVSKEFVVHGLHSSDVLLSTLVEVAASHELARRATTLPLQI